MINSSSLLKYEYLSPMSHRFCIPPSRDALSTIFLYLLKDYFFKYLWTFILWSNRIFLICELYSYFSYWLNIVSGNFLIFSAIRYSVRQMFILGLPELEFIYFYNYFEFVVIFILCRKLTSPFLCLWIYPFRLTHLSLALLCESTAIPNESNSYALEVLTDVFLSCLDKPLKQYSSALIYNLLPNIESYFLHTDHATLIYVIGRLFLTPFSLLTPEFYQQVKFPLFCIISFTILILMFSTP